MSNAIAKWQGISLILRIIIGMAVGIAFALSLPDNTVLPIFGKVFVGLLKGIAPILVFVLVISALANASGNIGARFKNVILLYIFGTFFAAVTAVCASTLFPVTMKLTDAASDAAPEGIGQILTTIITNVVANPVNAIMTGNYLSILCWAIIFGLGFKKLASKATCDVIGDMANVVAKAVYWIIQLAPFGIMGLVFSAVAENGLEIFVDYGRLLLVLVGCMIAMAFIVNPLITFFFLRRNPYPLVLKCLKISGVTAFFTRSSAANIPVNMELCKEMDLDEDFYSVSIPLGATINMEGAAITITVMALAVANTLGISVDLPTAILLSILSAIGACGASRRSRRLFAANSYGLCSLFGISNDIAMQAVGVGFIIGVIQDSCETGLNSSTDALFTAIAEFYDRRKHGQDFSI